MLQIHLPVVNGRFFCFACAVPSAAKPAKARKRRPALPHRHPRRTREEHSQEIAQDYVEIIAELIAATGEARVIDLARRLGVTHVTVARHDSAAATRRTGHKPAIPLHFSDRGGSKLSEESRTRHEIVVEFLESLGVPALDRAIRRRGDRASCEHGNSARIRETSAQRKRENVEILSRPQR